MLENHETIAAILGLVVLVFFFVHRDKLGSALHPRILIASLGLFVASLICSVVEVLFWEDTLNFLQHLLAPASIVLLAIWSWLTFVQNDGASA